MHDPHFRPHDAQSVAGQSLCSYHGHSQDWQPGWHALVGSRQVTCAAVGSDPQGRELLRQLRERAGLTQALLAERAGLSERAISDIERGQKQPRQATLHRLVSALESEAGRLPDQDAEAFRTQLTACMARLQVETRRRFTTDSRPMPAAPPATGDARVRRGPHSWKWSWAVAPVAIVLLGSVLVVGNVLAGRFAPVTGPTPDLAASRATTTVPVLAVGNTGVDVETVQLLLRHRGYGDVAVTGSFDGATERALRTFQGENGLVADGVVGPQTWAKLFVNVREGSRGDAVLAVQVQLNRKQGAGLDEHGQFDGTLRDAVLAFQRRAQISVDGIVGPETWQQLLVTPVMSS